MKITESDRKLQEWRWTRELDQRALKLHADGCDLDIAYRKAIGTLPPPHLYPK